MARQMFPEDVDHSEEGAATYMDNHVKYVRCDDQLINNEGGVIRCWAEAANAQAVADELRAEGRDAYVVPPERHELAKAAAKARKVAASAATETPAAPPKAPAKPRAPRKPKAPAVAAKAPAKARRGR